MKHALPVMGLLIMPLVSGCSNPADAPPRHPRPAPTLQLPELGTQPASTSAPLPPGRLNPEGGEQPPALPAPEAGIVLERDADRADELVDYSEKVFIQWNDALKQFRAKENRPPHSLAELQKFRPKLQSWQAPRGFQLELDPTLGEINIVRARR